MPGIQTMFVMIQFSLMNGWKVGGWVGWRVGFPLSLERTILLAVAILIMFVHVFYKG